MEVVNISKFLHMILCYTYSDLIYFIDDNFFMPHQSTISCLDLGQYLIWRLLIHLEILMGICFHQKILNLTTTWLCLFLFKELKTTCHTMACGYFMPFKGKEMCQSDSSLSCGQRKLGLKHICSDLVTFFILL